MKQLYIDFDGVILDTITPTYEELEKLNIRDDIDEVLSYYQNIDWDNLINISEELNDSINSIKNIISSNKFYVSILTHVNSLNEMVSKTKFLRTHIEEIQIISVPKSLSKTEIVNPKNAILIDDYIGNLEEWEKKGGIAVRFSPKLSGKGFKVINKLDQILEMIEEAA